MGRELIGAQFILEQQKKDYEEQLEEQKRYIKTWRCYGMLLAIVQAIVTMKGIEK
jgi:hypothetical protein